MTFLSLRSCPGPFVPACPAMVLPDCHLPLLATRFPYRRCKIRFEKISGKNGEQGNLHLHTAVRVLKSGLGLHQSFASDL